MPTTIRQTVGVSSSLLIVPKTTSHGVQGDPPSTHHLQLVL